MKILRLLLALSLVFTLVTFVAISPTLAKPIVLKWTTFAVSYTHLTLPTTPYV